MTDKEKLIKLYKKTIDLENEMLAAKDKLGKQATKMLGYEVVADLCNGGEVEFRRMMPDGEPDHNDCIRIEDII